MWNPISAQVHETVIKPRTEATSELLEAALKDRDYLVGNQLTAADGEYGHHVDVESSLLTLTCVRAQS